MNLHITVCFQCMIGISSVYTYRYVQNSRPNDNAGKTEIFFSFILSY